MPTEQFKDWCGDVHVTDTMGVGWCVRIDGCDVHDDINQHDVKTRRCFAIASNLPSKEEANDVAIKWLKDQLAAMIAGQAGDAGVAIPESKIEG